MRRMMMKARELEEGADVDERFRLLVFCDC